MKGKELKKK